MLTPEDDVLNLLSKNEKQRAKSFDLRGLTKRRRAQNEASISHISEYVAEKNRLSYITPDITIAQAEYIVLLKYTGRA